MILRVYKHPNLHVQHAFLVKKNRFLLRKVKADMCHTVKKKTLHTFSPVGYYPIYLTFDMTHEMIQNVTFPVVCAQIHLSVYAS